MEYKLPTCAAHANGALAILKTLSTAGAFALLSACGGGGEDASPPPSSGHSTGEVYNAAPVSNAGSNLSIIAGSSVTLDGSASSDANGDQISYHWSLTSKPFGSNATIADPTWARPSLFTDLAGDYVISLVVNDGKLSSTAAIVKIVAAIANAAPMANAGNNQSVTAGSTVTLDGTASSDANGDPITYHWTFTSKPAGSSATITDPTLAKPTFFADVAGNYVVSLVVSDGKLSSQESKVTVTAAVANVAPVAHAGNDQNVTTKTLILLDGSASSDANGDPITYHWTFTSKPAGSSATITDPTLAKPTFFADIAGNYVVSLVVSDGKLSSQESKVTVTAAVANVAPVAHAGNDQNVTLGTTVILDGSGSSDANGNTLTYQWQLTSRPTGSVAALASPASAKTTFIPDIAGDYVASLTVSDGELESTPSNVTIRVERANSTPVANAGNSVSINTGKQVTLDGTASTDADGDAITYSWRLVSKPFLSLSGLKNATMAKPSITPDKTGDYVIGLIVNDGKLNSTESRVTISAIKAANPLPDDTGLVIGTTGTFTVIDESTLQSKLTTSTTECHSIIGQDVRPDGVMVGVMWGGTNALVEIDPYQPVCTKKFDIPAQMSGLAVDSDGNYWMTTSFADINNKKWLYKYSPSGNMLSKIELANGFIGGLDFAPDGSLYGVGFGGQLHKVDPTSGSTTKLAELGNVNHYDIDIDSQGALRAFVANSADLVKYDLSGNRLALYSLPNVCSSCGFMAVTYHQQTTSSLKTGNRIKMGRRSR